MTADLLDELADLIVDRLADRVADEVAARLGATTMLPAAAGTSSLVTLDELVAELPPAKRPETWKAWLYERLRRGEVPGAVKLAGSWFFDPPRARGWIESGAPCSRPDRMR